MNHVDSCFVCRLLALTAEGESGCITEGESWLVLIDMLHALTHLATHKLIHLDIKPDNIFVTFSGTGLNPDGSVNIVAKLSKFQTTDWFSDLCFQNTDGWFYVIRVSLNKFGLHFFVKKTNFVR